MAAAAATPDLTVDAINSLNQSIATLVGKLGSAPPNRGEQMLNAQQPPNITHAFNTDSQPFSMHRFMAGYAMRGIPQEVCPNEYALAQKYTKALRDTNCELQGVAGGLWFPLNIEETYGGKLVANDAAAKDIAYVKAVLSASQPQFDPDEVAWLARRAYIKSSTGQSAFISNIGESLVAPPVQGPTIPLVRPNTAFLAAGAQSITLPPNGKMTFPRITGAPGVKATGEGQTTEISVLNTGFMVLQSKKIAGMVMMTEEASAYTSGSMDAIAQAELGRSLGLRIDQYAFYGIGDTEQPAGLTSPVYAGNGTTTGVINVPTFNPSANGLGANGNTLLPQYGDIFPALIEERSFGVEEGVTGAWIMRPAVYASAVSARASAVAANDQQGPMVDILRRFEASGPNVFKGRRVVRTTNLRNDRVKGASSNLSDLFFGIWRYGIMASYAAINFQQGHNGTTFANGQYLIRGTMFADIGFQYPEAFLWYPDVQGLTQNW